MRVMKPVPGQFVISCGIVLGLFAVMGFLSWTLTAPAQANEKVERKVTVDQNDKSGFGRFVSFRDGTLTLENNSRELIAWHKIAENADTFKFDLAANDYKRVTGTAAALNQVTTGTYVMVGDKRAYIRIGARQDRVVGAFVSFKNNRLLTLGKNLPEAFIKRYGSSLLYNKFRDDVPVYESVDGGEYKLIGTADRVLPEVKEGTILTVQGEGDDNITLIQIGTPKD